jgi:carbon storage regulator CsrA
MLVLTRKLQEKIHIGDNVTITIVRIQGNTVRVGIEAPQDVRVVRGEISATEPPVVVLAGTMAAADAAACSQSEVAHDGMQAAFRAERWRAECGCGRRAAGIDAPNRRH